MKVEIYDMYDNYRRIKNWKQVKEEWGEDIAKEVKNECKEYTGGNWYENKDYGLEIYVF